MNLDLVDLRLFVAVLDFGSITRGAAEAGLSLPAASERLRGLEADFNVTLLERSRRGVAPTEAGEALAHHARTVLRQVAQLRGELGEHAGDSWTTIRLAANTAAISEFLPEKLATWMIKYPKVRIELKERQSPEIAKAVAAGFAEIGILSDAVDTAGLQLRPFAIDRLVVVTPRGHPISNDKSVSFCAILHEQFVGLTEGALQHHIDAQAAKLGTKLSTRIRVRGFQAICQLVGVGVGIGIVPEAAAQRSAHSSNAVYVRLTEDWATRQLSLCFSAEKDLTPSARALLDDLAAR